MTQQDDDLATLRALPVRDLDEGEAGRVRARATRAFTDATAQTGGPPFAAGLALAVGCASYLVWAASYVTW